MGSRRRSQSQVRVLESLILARFNDKRSPTSSCCKHKLDVVARRSNVVEVAVVTNHQPRHTHRAGSKFADHFSTTQVMSVLVYFHISLQSKAIPATSRSSKMAKRGPEDQLTKDDYNSDGEGSEDVGTGEKLSRVLADCSPVSARKN